MKHLFFVLLLIFSISCKEKRLTEPKNWVSDFENVLTEDEEANLNYLIHKFEKSTGNEIALITVNDIGNSASIQDHAVKYGQEWGVGKKESDNGLVILFSSNMKETFLATGNGTQKYLTDEICKSIIDSTMIPHFKQALYYEGLKAGLEECIKKWN